MDFRILGEAQLAIDSLVVTKVCPILAGMNTAYRYRYNGKESMGLLGGRYDYGFRMYDGGIARFLTIDPLTKKYPELTPYQFASNTPIQAIDLDGLEAFFVHGSVSSSKRYTSNATMVTVLREFAGNKSANTNFEWGTYNGYFNQQGDRFRAAMNLTNHVMDNLGKDENITLIGHSHGGNVAIQAIPMIRSALFEKVMDRKIYLITISTPAYNRKDDPENPENSDSNSHKHFYSNDDPIMSGLSNIVGQKRADSRYTNKLTKNFQVETVNKDNKNGPGTPMGPLDAHSFDSKQPNLIPNTKK